MRSARAVACVGGFVSLLACGGGGGGGSSHVADVSIDSVSPVQAAASQYSGLNPTRIDLVFALGGNLSSLAGHTVIVKVEQSSDVFNLIETVLTLNDLRDHASLGIYARPDLPVDDYTGTLKIRACLDPNCDVEFAGSPVTVPFSLQVLHGLVLSQNDVTVSVPFGTMPDWPVLSLSLPLDLEDVDYDFWSSSGFSSAIEAVSVGSGPDVPITVRLHMTAPGHYAHSYEAHLWGTNRSASSDRRLEFRQELNITYDVTPNPSVVCAMAPGSSITVGQGSPGSPEVYVERVTRDATFDWYTGAVEYLSAPPEATGDPSAQDWLVNSLVYTVAPCGRTMSHCLPPGTYQAVMHFSCQNLSGESVNTDHRVTMIIAPASP